MDFAFNIFASKHSVSMNPLLIIQQANSWESIAEVV